MYICAVCEDSPGLCSAECFEAYHLRTQRGGVLNVQRAQVSARAQVPVAPNPILSPIANRTRGGLRRRRRATPSPVGTRTRGAKRKRSQHPPPPPPNSDSSSTPSPVAEMQIDSPPLGTSTQEVDPETGLTMLQPAIPAIPVAVVAPVRKKTKRDEPGPSGSASARPSGSASARRHPDGSYIGLTDSDNEDGNNRQNEGGSDRELDFDEF